MTKKINPDEIRAFMSKVGPETKIYFGCDSSRFKVKGKWYAEYATVIVVHINGKNGCRVFAQVETEPDYDGNASRPFNRMFTEARKVADLYLEYKDLFEDYECAIHLDINSKKTAGSSVALEAATGYVKGMTQVQPELKPMAWCASYAADRAVEILDWQSASK